MYNGNPNSHSLGLHFACRLTKLNQRLVKYSGRFVAGRRKGRSRGRLPNISRPHNRSGEVNGNVLINTTEARHEPSRV